MPKFDGGVRDVFTFEPEAVCGNFPGSGSGGAADEVTDGRVCGGTRRTGEAGATAGAGTAAGTRRGAGDIAAGVLGAY